MKKLIIVGLSLLGILALYALGMFGWEMYGQVTQLPQAEKEMGVDLGTPYVDGHEVIQFVQVDEDGGAYRAGVRKGDVLNQSSLAEFGRAYLNAQQSFSFVVLRGDQNLTVTIEKNIQ